MDNRPPYGFGLILEALYEGLPEAVREQYGPNPDQSLFVLYAHMESRPTVGMGESVTCGQHLGSVGSTGRSGNPHLHLEFRIGPSGAPLEKMAYYDTRATVAEMENYRRWRMDGVFVPVDPMLIFRNG